MMQRILPQYTNLLVIINHLVGQSYGIQNNQILVVINPSPILELLFGQQGDNAAHIINTQKLLPWDTTVVEITFWIKLLFKSLSLMVSSLTREFHLLLFSLYQICLLVFFNLEETVGATSKTRPFESRIGIDWNFEWVFIVVDFKEVYAEVDGTPHVFFFGGMRKDICCFLSK